ncbi:PfkB family carbohydrate kinase [Microbacterium pseudoresistens]|uniref:Sugar/nucleoside kinase (Ribokinase family) n=1 Tax=Microbacterium pseudoresistens TaxID=640634 RepID=A0A7Y9EU38_9MICO|nr:PfkB family carbohydrate kinase [Microbacterium pseudoresistens]NYD53876.1 sugar/nucleoside kinase (ribokinase family) [Microbacterium pseudoresistens]
MRTDAGPTRRPRVIHTGQALVDQVVEVPELPARGQNVMANSVADYAGGAVTVLLAATRLGAACVHAGAHGTGPRGDLIRAALAADGITASAPPVTDRDTGVCVVLVEPTAERTFVTTLGAERDITVESLSTADVQPGDLVCVTGYSLAVAQTRDPLLGWMATLPPEAVVVLDPGAAFATLPAEVRDAMLARTDVWTSNAEEATDLLAVLSTPAPADADEREIAAQARALEPVLREGAVAIVRDGPEGCAVSVQGEATYVPGFPQKPVDTNGAGDTHTGALLAGIAAGASWVDACRRANAAGAITVTRRGPSTAPTAAEVDAFLGDRARPAMREGLLHE